MELSIAALTRVGERASLAAIARTSKTVDPQEPDGISESAILHNDEAYALYRQHSQNPRHRHRKPSAERGTDIILDAPLRVNANRNHGRARQRYLGVSKTELVQRLLAVEKTDADMENRWLQTADDLLVWITLVDRLIAASQASGSSP